jgi:prophage tail gpP-like protein
MDNLILCVNNREYSGWESISISRGIESVAGSFEISASDRWSGEILAWPIHTEDFCSLRLPNRAVILEGYVDHRKISYGASEHVISIAGREKTAVLVDCSVAGNNLEFSNITLLDFAKKICGPYGIGVAASGSAATEKNKKISVDLGSTVFDALEKSCRLQGYLPISNGSSGIVLSRAGSSRASTALVEGQNILTASLSVDASTRYHTYRVVGQHQGGDWLTGAAASAISATAVDAGVSRTDRVLIVHAEGCISAANAKSRAQWEATVRAARGIVATVAVQGWTQSDGSMWRPNSLVAVRSPLLEIDAEMLISEVIFSLDSNGTRSELHLKSPDSFIFQPRLPPQWNNGWRELAGGV